MKSKYFLGCLLLANISLLQNSCTENAVSEIITSDYSPQSSSSSTRSIDEAISIAMNAVNNTSFATRSNSINKRKIDYDNGIYVVNNPITRSDDITADTLLYIINYDDNQGFAIVSANKETEGLLAVTESGHFIPTDSTGNSGFDMFYQMAKQYVSSSRYKPGPIQLIIVNDTIANAGITPKVTVKWGQEGVEGTFCPNNCAGCAITACAMLMSYFKHPSSITLTYPGASAPSQVLNWDSINTHVIDDYISLYFCSDDVHTSIGNLCRQLGHICNSQYNLPSGPTNTTSNNTRSMLQQLGYTVGNYSSYNYANVVAALLNNNLILMRGETANGGAHMWLVDGYSSMTIRHREYTLEGTDIYTLILEDLTTYSYLHINWGYDGYNNGYFAANCFNMDIYASLDDPSLIMPSYATYNFVNELKYFAVSH